MNEQFVRDFAAQVGMTVEYAYGVITRWQAANGLVMLGGVGAVLLLSALAAVVCGRVWWLWTPVQTAQRLNNEGHAVEVRLPKDPGPAFWGAVLGAVVTFIVTAALAAIVGDGLLHLTNPEYYTIKVFLDAVKR